MTRSEVREAVLQVVIERLEGIADDEAWTDRFDPEDVPALVYEYERLIERITEMGEE